MSGVFSVLGSELHGSLVERGRGVGLLCGRTVNRRRRGYCRLPASTSSGGLFFPLVARSPPLVRARAAVRWTNVPSSIPSLSQRCNSRALFQWRKRRRRRRGIDEGRCFGFLRFLLLELRAWGCASV